jgi:repressor of nif and glnA expression
LRALEESPTDVSGRGKYQRLSEHGIDLNERTVRYHMRILDERGYQIAGRMGRVKCWFQILRPR